LNSPLGKVITVTTGKIQSEARFTQTKAGVRSVQGSTSLLNVRIDSDALGIHKTYSGKPKPNDVLYHNSDNSLIIYLNRQIKTTVAGKVAGITVDAIDVQLNNLKFAGQRASGSITVGPAVAK
ncbi:MAG TPA: choice-of-anchor P family protein, partial [Alphaproteobacteria bacterium]|nr:choice-of-anchor P family protein [Alphaproteobacteria bacterium]